MGARGRDEHSTIFPTDDTEPELQAHIRALIMSKLESTCPQTLTCYVAKKKYQNILEAVEVKDMLGFYKLIFTCSKMRRVIQQCFSSYIL